MRAPRRRFPVQSFWISTDALQRRSFADLRGITRASRRPAFDALGADGVVFERFYSHVPQSLPAHAAMFSSRLPFETGVRDNAGFKVKDSERTLAEVPERYRDYASRARDCVSAAPAAHRRLARGFARFSTIRSKPGTEPPTKRASVPSRVTAKPPERIAETWLQSIATPRAFLFLHLTNALRARHGTAHPDRREPHDAEVERADEVVGRPAEVIWKGHQLYDQSTIIVTSAYGDAGLGDHAEATPRSSRLRRCVMRVPLDREAGGR